MRGDVEILKAAYTTAENVTFVGECDDCKHEALYFFTLPQFFDDPASERVNGGFYCVDCGFGNAGSYPRELVSGF